MDRNYIDFISCIHNMNKEKYGVVPIENYKNVKTLKENKYDIEIEENEETLNWWGKTVKEFNEIGNITRQIFYYSASIEQIINFKYDSKNNLIEQNSSLGFKITINYIEELKQIKMLNYYEKGIIDSEVFLQYNSEMQLETSISKIVQNSNEFTKHYKYRNKKLISTLYYDQDELVSEFNIKYEGTKKIVTIHSIELKLTSKSVVHLNGKGMEVKNELFNSENQIVSISVFKYDKNDRLILSLSNNLDENKLANAPRSHEIKHEYDSNGNWVKKISSINEIKTSCFEREMIYY